MAIKSISQLDTQATANETDLFEVAIVDANSASGYASKKESAAAIADAIVGEYQYPLRITGTTAKTIAGAINELKNLVDLLPQFAIEVVQTLPVSDISETTIYLVPAQDPEQGNYYEEYIYVNNAWELVGTTAVDLSGYYTSAQVDTLLAAKANTADVSAALELKENAADMEEDVTDIVVDLTDTQETAEGNPVTLQTVQEGYAKAVTIKLTPKQDLHGYDKPWAGGGGKNQFPNSSTFPYSSTIINTYYAEFSPNVTERKIPIIHIKPNVTYTLSMFVTASKTPLSISVGVGDGRYMADIIVVSGFLGNTRCSVTFTATPEQLEQGDVLAFRTPRYSERGDFNCSVSDVQLEEGSTATAFEPYENVCPIEGYEEISATRTGVDGVTATAEFPETIYGAEGDVAGGDWDKEWGYIASYNGETLPAEWMSDRDEYEPNTTPTTGAEVAYELATPEPFQTAPAPLTLRKGNNTITTDGDSVKVKYNKLALPDIGGIGKYISSLEARIEALEGANSNRSLSVSPVLTKSLTSDSDTTEGKTEETEEETKEEAQNER